ncbi:MAG: LptF/LptG family permease [Planctomycetes bacterium]|nr:LptF/LptG family permease [Planctomycetota bacterium]
MTFDRYLLRSFIHTFGVCFVATFGLVIVIDLLENLDEFLKGNGDRGTAALLKSIAECYTYQSIFFLDRAGPALTIISLMVLLVLLQRSGELHPLLAAGIPMYRVLAPLILATSGVFFLLALNQEFVVPRIAHAAFETRGGGDATRNDVESFTDHSTGISINGDAIRLSTRTIDKATFFLPSPRLANDITILEAPTATFFPASGSRPAGWLLRDVSPAPADLRARLTDAGREAVYFFSKKESNLFVASSVTADQLCQRSSSYSFLSTSELLQRIRCPAFGLVSVHRLVLHLHARLAQPLLNIIAIFIVVPLMIRRESPGIVADSALCGFVLASLFAVVQGSQMLGMNQFVPADLAAWIPVVIGGSVSAWLSGVIRT